MALLAQARTALTIGTSVGDANNPIRKKVSALEMALSKGEERNRHYAIRSRVHDGGDDLGLAADIEPFTTGVPIELQTRPHPPSP
jgi:hypothetical protein